MRTIGLTFDNDVNVSTPAGKKPAGKKGAGKKSEAPSEPAEAAAPSGKE